MVTLRLGCEVVVEDLFVAAAGFEPATYCRGD